MCNHLAAYENYGSCVILDMLMFGCNIFQLRPSDMIYAEFRCVCPAIPEPVFFLTLTFPGRFEKHTQRISGVFMPPFTLQGSITRVNEPRAMMTLECRFAGKAWPASWGKENFLEKCFDFVSTPERCGVIGCGTCVPRLPGP